MTSMQGYLRQGGQIGIRNTVQVVFLVECAHHVAKKVAERCQRLIHKQAIVHADSPHGQCVTVSVGVGTVVPDASRHPSSFIEAVDQQLYAAKKNGRNRIEVAPIAA